MIRQYPDSCLTTPSEPYTPEETCVAMEHANYMLEVLGKYSRRGVGLAAPQVGHNRRLFVLDSKYLKMDCGPVFINPTLLWQSDEKEEDEEGCLSFPERVTVKVCRSKSITLCYDTQDREGIIVDVHGLAARACLHEMDHLDGVTLFTHMEPLQKRDFRRLLEK